MPDGNPEEKGTGKNVKEGRGNLTGKGWKPSQWKTGNLAGKGRKPSRRRTETLTVENGKSSQGKTSQRGVPLPPLRGAFYCGGKIILTEKKNGKVSVGERKRTGLPCKGKTRKGEFRCRPLEERFVAGGKIILTEEKDGENAGRSES